MDGDMEQLGRLAGGVVDQLQACRPVSLSRAACQDMATRGWAWTVMVPNAVS